MKISLSEAINIFRNDLAKLERDITREVKVTLSQNQFDELVARPERETAMFRNADYSNPIIRFLESKNGREEHFTSAQVEALFSGG
ncbi:hypothetical protein [Rhizobium sp. RHZ01]|uniref:glycoside hydrolase family protein n=1 Tax=Rhizobium sp. RHZ01 TaxID=2769304 RepID=UPI00177D0069|nr:hypothetical protein [Rhizobium sp. RHZ01]MBD9449846.1 hypothetical protein [Rhizobium sp. RHZ01]